MIENKNEFNNKTSFENLVKTESLTKVGHWEWIISQDKVVCSPGLLKIYEIENEEVPLKINEFDKFIVADDIDYFSKTFNLAIEKREKSSRYKITVFLICVMTIALTAGVLMYLIEGSESSFSSIPKGIYWSIVTMTTVGYGDIVPQTDLGKALAAFLMITGYGIIAVPTGIVSVEIANATNNQNTRTCKSCLAEGHRGKSKHCWSCGAKLN